MKAITLSASFLLGYILAEETDTAHQIEEDMAERIKNKITGGDLGP